MALKKKIRKQVQAIIEKEYLTDWEFIVERIAPELEEEDFDELEIAVMIQEEKSRRTFELYKQK